MEKWGANSQVANYVRCTGLVFDLNSVHDRSLAALLVGLGTKNNWYRGPIPCSIYGHVNMISVFFGGETS